MSTPPSFDVAFRAKLSELLAWRRDVRAFRRDPIPEAVLQSLLALAARGPSVGNSQPSRFVIIRTAERRRALAEHVTAEQTAAASIYDGPRTSAYLQLKLHGLGECPVVLAVYCVDDPLEGGGLGRQTMPQALIYSTICAIHTLWLAARAEGIGLGWVSILAPETIAQLISVPSDWHCVGLLCLGYPETEVDVPALQTQGWQARLPIETFILER